MNRFSCETQIVSGAGAVSVLSELGCKRLLMVTDPFFYENGTAAKIAAQANAQAVAYFHKITPDPDARLVAQGTAVLTEFAPDLVVALGGGSAMDCAKAMGYFAKTDAKLVAIPTTSGSGSEVTDFAIVTYEGVKHPLVDKSLRPHMAILDSDLLSALPPNLVADGGFDVLSHALEALAGKNSSGMTHALAVDAFRSAYYALPDSYGGILAARPIVHTAATMAALAFTHAGLGLCHALSHSLGGAFHLPHGRLNAILLPAVLSRNIPAAGHKYASLARSIGLQGQSDTVAVGNLKRGLLGLRKNLNMPGTLAQAGIPPAKVRQMADSIVAAALQDPCCDTNPVPVTAPMVRGILEEVTGG